MTSFNPEPTATAHFPIPERLSIVWLLLLLVSGTVHAGQPTIRELSPWGAQRGQAVTLTVTGDQLETGAEVFSAVPGKLQEQAGGNAGQLTFQLEIRPDAAVGVYPIRLRTRGGLSNVLLFSVGDLPEAMETEPNDTLPTTGGSASSNAGITATAITLPVTVNGSAPGTDQDVFRFSGQKNQRIILEVEAQRIGSQLDPALHLYSNTGRELAFVDDTRGLGVDCRLDSILPEDGDYFVVLHDSKYSGASPAYYRLKAGSFAYAESLFPLGGQRGQQVAVTLSGGTLSEPVRVAVLADSSPGAGRMFLSPSLAGPQARLPFRFVLGDTPEQTEPETSAIDERWFKDAGVMNGRIGQPGEIDRYKFAVAPGQTWIFEVDAANLGSPLDPVLTVTGPQGNVLAVADDGNGIDSRLQFAVPAGLDHVVLAVEDLYGRGGTLFAYRLKARMPRSEFSLQVVPAGQAPVPGAPPALGPTAINIPRGGLAVAQVNVVRDGYNGPIQLTIPETVVGISAEDGLIPAGGSSGLLVLSAAADAPMQALDLEINGQGGAATKPIVRPVTASRASYAMADGFAARVPAAICEAAPASFTVAERSIKIVHGQNRTLKIAAQRGPAATEGINIVGTGLPVVSGTNGMMAKDSSELVLTLNCSPENPVVGSFTMQLQATTQAAGRQETVQITPVNVDIVRPFSVELVSQNLAVTPGSKLRIAVLVRRESPFDGSVKVGPAGSLPQHVSLTTVDVPKGESLALLELEVDDQATPAELDVPIRATTDMEGRKRDKEYVIPDSSVKLKIVSKTTP